MAFIARSLSTLGLLAVAWAQTGGISGVWHYINVQDIICPGRPGYATLTMVQPAVLSPDPTVFTVFRTTTNPVTLSFVARDAAGSTVVDQSAPITLQAVTARYGRRLEQAEDIDEAAPIRGLLSRRRSSSPRRRTYTDSRRRTITDSRRRTATLDSRRRSVTESPRRRAIAESPRRRSILGSPRRRFMTDTRRRVDSSRRRGGSSFVPSYQYSNPLSPRIGQYGYASPSYAYHNYGGHPPISTSYGYTGANAYSSGSGMKIALAAGGGLLAGYAASHLFNSGSQFGGYSHDQMMNAPCTSGSWSGTCNSCLSQYGANRCDVTLSPNFDATRDDLMNTGFIPTQISWPVSVTVMSVSGGDFNPAVVCQPAMTASMARLFLTTTTLAVQPSGGGPPGPAYHGGYSDGYGHSSYQSGGSGFVAWFSTVLGCCCCCGLGVCCYATSKKGRKPSKWSPFGGDSDSDSDSESVHMVHQDAYNPYWNGQVHAQSSVAFMDTPAPGGISWSSYCRDRPKVSSESGFVDGRWGDCLAWAVIYEHQNPDWERNPSYRDMGPAGSVISAMLEKSSDSDCEAVEAAANKLESACRQAIAADGPLPVIDRKA